MPRGNRSIFFALVGWLTLCGANPPEQSAKTEDVNSSQEIGRAANSIAVAIRETFEAPEQDTGCEDRKDNRSSDLCAQWKAADAARDAANYALWSLFIGILGTGFLLWTLWETHATARRQLRAYVSVSPTDLHVKNGGKDGMTVGVKLKNGGATPAYDCFHAGNIVAFNAEQAAEFFSPDNEAPRIGEKAAYVLHGGQETTGDISSHTGFSAEQFSGLRSGALTLYVFGYAEYVDTFRKVRRSEFCYSMPTAIFVEGERQSQRSKSDKPIPFPLVWDLAPFHNRAT